MARSTPLSPAIAPSHEGGWSEEMIALKNAVVVPTAERAFRQKAGVLDAKGVYQPHGALWRYGRAITLEPDAPAEVTRTLPGRWLYGGVMWRNFGHFIAESLSRLWALHYIQEDLAGIVFVPKSSKVSGPLRAFQTDMLAQFRPGLTTEVVHEPVRVEELFVPGQGFGMGEISMGTPRYVQAVREGFARDIAPDGPERLYISRTRLPLVKGGLLGEDRIEELLRRDGYEPFYPEEHDIPTQLARYKAAKQVLGVDGSAFHTFGFVARNDQRAGLILRRTSGHRSLRYHLKGFMGKVPDVMNALRTEWVTQEKAAASRLSFGEVDLENLGGQLKDNGYIASTEGWDPMTEAERAEIYKTRNIGEAGGFVEEGRYVRNRVRAIRRERRAKRDEAEAQAAATPEDNVTPKG